MKVLEFSNDSSLDKDFDRIHLLGRIPKLEIHCQSTIVVEEEMWLESGGASMTKDASAKSEANLV
jgi:hypothetical protein